MTAKTGLRSGASDVAINAARDTAPESSSRGFKPRPQRFLSSKDLMERGINYSRVQLWRLIRAGEFPRPVQLSKQRSAWREADIDEWMAARPLAVGKSEAA
jgi:prophage regulatory protein